MSDKDDEVIERGASVSPIAQPTRLTSSSALAAVSCSCIACSGPNVDQVTLFFDLVLDWGGQSPKQIIEDEKKLQLRLHRVWFPRAAEEFAAIDDLEWRAQMLATIRVDPQCIKIRLLIEQVASVEYWGAIAKAHLNQSFAYDEAPEVTLLKRKKKFSCTGETQPTSKNRVSRKPRLSRFLRSDIAVTMPRETAKPRSHRTKRGQQLH